MLLGKLKLYNFKQQVGMRNGDGKGRETEHLQLAAGTKCSEQSYFKGRLLPLFQYTLYFCIATEVGGLETPELWHEILVDRNLPSEPYQENKCSLLEFPIELNNEKTVCCVIKVFFSSLFSFQINTLAIAFISGCSSQRKLSVIYSIVSS